MLSIQQQSNMINNNPHLSSVNTVIPPMNMQSAQQQQQQQQQQQENQHDRSTVNSQQGLADKIQAVRHLWESENQYSNPSQYAHQMANYNPQQASSVVDPAIYNHMNTTFQQATQGFIQFQ
jgi:hypothetical protein